MELDKILPVARRGLLLAKGNHCFFVQGFAYSRIKYM